VLRRHQSHQHRQHRSQQTRIESAAGIGAASANAARVVVSPSVAEARRDARAARGGAVRGDAAVTRSRRETADAMAVTASAGGAKQVLTEGDLHRRCGSVRPAVADQMDAAAGEANPGAGGVVPGGAIDVDQRRGHLRPWRTGRRRPGRSSRRRQGRSSRRRHPHPRRGCRRRWRATLWQLC